MGRHKSFLRQFAMFALVIGPVIVIAYILFWIPVEWWPVGSGTPDQSYGRYLLPMLPFVFFPGVILGGILFLMKELVTQ